MKFMLITETIYQQIVLLMIFYFGEIWFVWIHDNEFITYQTDCHRDSFNSHLAGPARWAEEHFYCDKTPGAPTPKNMAFSFIYETFFWMQMFNINNCRRVFDNCTVPFRRVLKLFVYGFLELIQKCKHRYALDRIKDEDERKKELERQENLINPDGRDPIYFGQFILYLISLIPAVVINELIMIYGHSTFRVT